MDAVIDLPVARGESWQRKHDAAHRRIELWRALRDEGGYWSVDELCRLMRNRDATMRYRKTGVVRILHGLVRDGCAVSRPTLHGVETFGVTTLCREPE